MGQKTGVAGPRVSRCDGRPATDAGRKSAIVANEGIAPTPPRIPLHRPRPRPAGRVAIKPLSPTWYSMIGVGQRLTSWRWVASGAAFTAAASVAAFVSPPAYSSPISSNRVLGDGRHRIGLCGWPLKGARAANDPRVATPRDLFGWVRKCGYEGVELTTEDFKSMYFEPETPSTVVIRDIRAAAAAAGMARVSSGGLYHVTDGGPSPYGNSGRPVLDFHSLGFEADVRRMLEDDMKLDCEYANFQIHLSPRYLNAGGAHRADEAYLSLCASRIEMLQRICHSLGLNCYIETHIERITEDPEAFVKIMDRARYFEINGDLSHYAYRAITQGRSLPRIMSRVNHLHCRMARPHGDLSADILDMAADWKGGGLTKQAYDYVQPAIEGGLSSRWVLGETGPMYGVTDALTLDQKLIPLWRKIAAAADEQVRAGHGQKSTASKAPAAASIEEAPANPFQLAAQAKATYLPEPAVDLQANPFRRR